jgi:hypothetical protein
MGQRAIAAGDGNGRAEGSGLEGARYREGAGVRCFSVSAHRFSRERQWRRRDPGH